MSARLLVALALALGLAACGPRLVPVLVFVPVAHEIGAWPDEDRVCVALPGTAALYLRSRCVSMQEIRAYILRTRSANE